MFVSDIKNKWEGNVRQTIKINSIMKKIIFSLLVFASLIFAGCNSSNKDNHKHTSANTQQSKDDGHNHADGQCSGHGVDDGHAHSTETHTEDDGHNHADGQCNGHGVDDGHGHTAEAHSEDDGHGHGKSCGDEIAFTKKQATAAGLKTETTKPASFSHVIKTSGQIQAPQGDEVTIVATTSGVVSFTNPSITDGTAVRSGESVAHISAKNLQDGDPVLRAKIAFETAEKEYKRAESLVADKIISAKQFEQARLEYENAKNVYQSQAGNVSSRGVSVNSPINGYIKNRLVAQGEYVSVGQPIATVAQNKRLQLRAEVSENNFKHLRSISSANFKTAYDDTFYKMSELNGKLLSYGKTSNNNSFYIPVTFEFDNVGDIIPGSFTEVYLLSQPRENVISLPTTALTEEQGLHFVYIQVEPEAFVKQEVKIGQSNGERTEILTGLNGGEKVVVNGVMQVKLAAVSGAIPHGHEH